MGKNKLRKFSELSEIDFVYQYPSPRKDFHGGDGGMKCSATTTP